jgi:hypothetical protein
VRIRLTVPAVLLLGALAVGCSANQPSSTPVGAAAGDEAELCPEVSLRTPSGQRLDLTGNWSADDFGDYDMTQRASCLHWLAKGPAVPLDDAEPGDWYTNVFVGQIGTDLSVHGEWADVPSPYEYFEGQPNSGEIVLEIGSFHDDLGAEWPSLHMVELRDARDGYNGENWVPTNALPPRTEYVGRYEFENGCSYIELNGQRYELNGWQYDVADQGQIMGDGAQVLARPGDELRIDGQIWPDPNINSLCVPNKIIVWDLQVAP